MSLNITTSFYPEGSHRFLDHERGVNAPLNGKNDTLRAEVTEEGYCIEYRESKMQHFERLGTWIEQKPARISGP